MRPHHAVQALRGLVGRPWEGAERVAALHTCLCSQLPDRFHHHQTGESRPALTRDHARKRFGAPHPTRLDPPVAAIDLVSAPLRDRLIARVGAPEPRAQVVTIAVQARLICLSAQHVVCALRLNLPGDLHLAPHRLDGHDGSGSIEPAEPRGEGSDLVGFRVNFARRQPQLMG